MNDRSPNQILGQEAWLQTLCKHHLLMQAKLIGAMLPLLIVRGTKAISCAIFSQQAHNCSSVLHELLLLGLDSMLWFFGRSMFGKTASAITLAWLNWTATHGSRFPLIDPLVENYSRVQTALKETNHRYAWQIFSGHGHACMALTATVVSADTTA